MPGSFYLHYINLNLHPTYSTLNFCFAFNDLNFLPSDIRKSNCKITFRFCHPEAYLDNINDHSETNINKLWVSILNNICITLFWIWKLKIHNSLQSSYYYSYCGCHLVTKVSQNCARGRHLLKSLNLIPEVLCWLGNRDMLASVSRRFWPGRLLKQEVILSMQMQRNNYFLKNTIIVEVAARFWTMQILKHTRLMKLMMLKYFYMTAF